MTADDAHQLLADLRDETARLRDPAELQFVGGDAAADAASLGAVAAQRAGVPALRLQAPALATATGRALADVLAEITAYDAALGTTVEALRARRAPLTAPRAQVAPRDSEPGDTSGPRRGIAADGLAPPSWWRGAIVAVPVLVVVVLVVVVLAFVLLR